MRGAIEGRSSSRHYCSLSLDISGYQSHKRHQVALPFVANRVNYSSWPTRLLCGVVPRRPVATKKCQVHELRARSTLSPTLVTIDEWFQANSDRAVLYA